MPAEAGLFVRCPEFVGAGLRIGLRSDNDFDAMRRPADVAVCGASWRGRGSSSLWSYADSDACAGGEPRAV